MPPVQQSKEVGLAVAAGGNQLAINDAGLCREAEDGRGDRWKPAREVSAIPTIDRRGEASFVKLHAVAVEFQFIQPIPSPLEGDVLSLGRAGRMKGTRDTSIFNRRYAPMVLAAKNIQC